MNKNETILTAAVDPEYLKQVSEMLKRKLTGEKDTANYNSQVISNFIDKTSVSLRDSGQSTILPGEGFKIDEEFDALIQNRMPNHDLFDKSKDVDRSLSEFPFSDKFERELRTKHILKTEALDTFFSLMDELDGLMPQFMTTEQWLKLKMAISKGNDRVQKNKLVFIEPEVYIGKEMKMSQKDLDKYGLRSDMGTLKYDLRPDGPDLLALKELVLMARGEDVHSLSFGPGFFAKYMPEFYEQFIVGIIFHVKANKLKSITFNEITLESIKKNFNLKERFTPADAPCILAADLQFKGDKFLETITNDDRYYVITHGRVAGPKDFKPFGYESSSFNEVSIDAGEVSLFYKATNNKVIGTRIYFVPYVYSSFHPYHQHGSVILGNNDQAYHSAGQENGGNSDGFYREEFINTIYAPNPLNIFQPSFVSAWAKKFPKEKIEILLEKDNRRLLVAACANIFEESPFLAPEVAKMGFIRLFFKKMGTSEDIINSFQSGVLDMLIPNFAPIHKRWTLTQYLKDGVGITEERQQGLLDNVTIDAKNNYAQQRFIEDVAYLASRRPKT